MRLKTILIVAGIVSLISSGVLLVSCGKKSLEGMIIITQASSSPVSPDYITGKSWRYVPESHLYAIDPGKPGKTPESLTEDFFSACSPEISYDGKYMLFAAQKESG